MPVRWRKLLIAMLAMLCAILCVALLLIWSASARTVYVLDRVRWEPQSRLYREERLLLAQGRAMGWYCRFYIPPNQIRLAPAAGWQLRRMHQSSISVSWNWTLAMARREWSDPPAGAIAGFGPVGYGEAGLHLGILALLAAAPPLLWWRQRQRDLLRRRAGFCGQCGYDLRATPTRCPECGAMAALG